MQAEQVKPVQRIVAHDDGLDEAITLLEVDLVALSSQSAEFLELLRDTKSKRKLHAGDV